MKARNDTRPRPLIGRALGAGLCLAVGAGLGLASPPALAQTDGVITYEQVLSDPDNIGLTVTYARQRIEAGELQKAAVSLERVLLLNPDLDEARLLYAVVLYRIANFAEAEAELNTLKDRDLSPSDRALVDQYLGLIAAQNRPWSAYVAFGIGGHYDTNRNNHPSSGQILVLNTVFNATGSENDDFGALAFASGEFAYKLSPVAPEEVFVRGALVADEQFKEDQLDLLGFFAALGGRTTIETYDFEATAGATVIGLAEEHFVDVYEGVLKASRTFQADIPVTPFIELGGGYEDFHKTDNSRFANEEDGGFLRAAVGVGMEFTPKVRGSIQAGVRRKDAEVDFNSYWRYELAATGSFALTEDLLFRAFGSAAIEDYSEADAFISATRERRDYDYRIGGDFIQRLDPLLAAMGIDVSGSLASGLAGTLGASYEVSDSNIRNFSYDNFRVRALLTKRVDF